MDSELATVIFMGLILKIPVVAMLCLVWWACRSQPAPAEEAGGEGEDHGFRRWRPQPNPPRRGPHGPATPAGLPAPAGRNRGPRVHAPVPVGAPAARLRRPKWPRRPA